MPPSTVVARTAPGRRTAPVGTITRGTTNPNRLRRADRWVVGTLAGLLRAAADPLVVDLGYGASPITTLELRDRLRAVRPDVRVVGIEIDPARVEAARHLADDSLQFVLGGFELPVPGGGRPVLVRAFNVLRQYPEDEAWAAWERLRDGLAPGGALIEGTCAETGRLAAWVALGRDGPRTITFAAHLTTLTRPSELAERLPKVLIHRNVPGERVHALLTAFDRAWAVAAPRSAFGPRQRWIAAVELLSRDHPVITPAPFGGRARWRLGEVTLPWHAVHASDR
jgi:hypothetical protein